MNAEKPHYYGHRQRLRERFIKNGLKGFADHEVIELLLTLAIPRGDMKEPAKSLIHRFGNLKGILDAPLEELQQVKGIGAVTPVALRIIKEAADLYLQQSAEERDSFTDTDGLFRFWRTRIGALSNEVFEVGYLDSGYKLLRDGVERLEEGTIDRAAVYPRSTDRFLRQNRLIASCSLTINALLSNPRVESLCSTECGSTTSPSRGQRKYSC